MRTDSVTSISRRLGGSPASLSADRMASRRLALRNCTADRLTATLTCSGHAIASRHACRSTHSPRSTIRPVLSAIGMNRSGNIRPWTGWRQRTSASTHDILRVHTSTTGLIQQFEFTTNKSDSHVRLKTMAIVGVLRHLGIEEEEAMATSGFGLVEREVGLLHEFLRFRSIRWRKRNTD